MYISTKLFAARILSLSVFTFALMSCFKPPYNHFRQYSSHMTNIGGSNLHTALINTLTQKGIQVIRYGDLMTLYIPTDRYFIFDTAVLNEREYQGLNAVTQLLQLYPQSIIAVAGFTDNIGSSAHKHILSQARAETILTLLWAHGISANRLSARGFADAYPIGNNSVADSSAYNRRVEIQWKIIPSFSRVGCVKKYRN